MHDSRFWFIALVSFLLVVGRSFLTNPMTVLVCRVFSFDALSCSANGSSANRANAAQTIEKIGEIPRLRHPEVQLPNDFRILYQMPMRSSNREILLVSPSTGTEQRYLIRPQDNETFELFQAEFGKVAGIDWRLFAARGGFNVDLDDIQQRLNTFKLSFTDNAVSTLHLAEGSTAEFTTEQIVIRSPDGQELETVPLPQTELSVTHPAIAHIPETGILGNPPAPRSLLFARADQRPTLIRSVRELEWKPPGEELPLQSPDESIARVFKVEPLRPKSNPVYWYTRRFALGENFPWQTGQHIFAQSESDCQQIVVASLYTGATQLDTLAKHLVSSQNETTRLAGWALKFGARAMKDNISPGAAHLQDAICRPPVQCDEEKVSGGSEVRTDLLQLSADIDRSQVSVQYDFFEIPDRLEFYYDGEQIFAVGPASGEDTKTVPIPDVANQVGIAVIGSKKPETKWWYKISCSQGDGEQGTGNGERKEGNGERRTENGERRTENGERRTEGKGG